MDIKEPDWKIFRKLHEVALERYCQRVLEDVRRTVDGRRTHHERYLKLWKLIRKRDKTMAYAFDNPRRSQAITQLANIVAEDLITDGELDQFSEETRARIARIAELRNSNS